MRTILHGIIENERQNTSFDTKLIVRHLFGTKMIEKEGQIRISRLNSKFKKNTYANKKYTQIIIIYRFISIYRQKVQTKKGEKEKI